MPVDSHCRSIILVRVVERLANGNLPFDAKFPVLMPWEHRFAQLYVEFLHKSNLQPRCCSISYGNGYGYQNARDLNRTSHYKHKVMTQIMGHLPADRLRSQQPFLVTGLDFYGPFFRSYRLRWIKTVHPEQRKDQPAIPLQHS